MATWDIFKDFLNSFSIIIASFTAIHGINSWRKEARWKRKYELAEEVLVLVYEVREAIRYIRNPLQTEDLGHPKRPSALKIVLDRREKYKDTFAKLQSIRYRFMVIHDKNSEKLFERMDMLFMDIVTAAWNLDNRYYKAYEENRWASEDAKLKSIEKMHELEDVIWMTGEDNEFDKKLSALITEFNSTCEKVINQGYFKPRLRLPKFKRKESLFKNFN